MDVFCHKVFHCYFLFIGIVFRSVRNESIIMFNDNIYKREYSCFFLHDTRNDGKHCDVYLFLTIPFSILSIIFVFFHFHKKERTFSEILTFS